MRKRTQFVVGFAALATGVMFAAETAKHNLKPKGGYVPDAKTAIRIAVAVWEPIYGRSRSQEKSLIRLGLAPTAYGLSRVRCRRVMLAASLSLKLRRKTARF